MTDNVSSKDAVDQSGISNNLKYYTLFILTIVYAFNFIDRQILVIMQEAIKVDLELTDTWLGFLSGPAFALFYTIVGIPIARYADFANRRNIIAVSLALWSGMTALSGLAQNVIQLAMARVGVGIGEAGGSPPSHSIISNMFKEKERATALAIYSSGLYLGILLGYILGGYLVVAYGWRNTFFIVGIPGVLMALLVRFTLKEPIRENATSIRSEPFKISDHFVGIFKVMGVLFRLKSFPYFALGCAMSAFISYGVGNFVPSYIIRYYDLSPSDFAIRLALSGGGGGMIGTFLGGYLTDKIGAKDIRWYLWLPGLIAVLAIPFAIWAYLVTDVDTMFILIFVYTVMGTLYLAPAIATAHRLVVPHMRAMASAVLFFILNLIGLGLGPLFIGFLSDYLTKINGVESLREAMIIGVCLAVIKGVLFYIGGRHLPEDLNKQADMK
ncbi:MFS transporter [Kordiimonas sp. SCSIO 12610]|uniref:spinster family MFS transporter n=1 Tax=Kordiimonas sp. SCSIO 12610 TaxID=2829597 RepID=UPI002108B3C2|nr:MFS transporter [Kordiimonas sp. SCSIO 12610]UTW54943.1 MFS transporter [Kordiimonas sp. SCSIO 12610]